MRGKNSPCPPISLIIQPQQKLDKGRDVFRYRECGESLGTGPRIQTPHNSRAFSGPTLKVNGDPSVSIKQRQQWAGVPFELCVLENGIIQRKMPLMPPNPTGRMLIQLQPFTLLTQDSSGRSSLKLLKAELLQSQRDVPILYWVKSQLPVTSFLFVCFKRVKQRKRG